MIYYVGEIIVSDHGICKVIDVDENGIYTAETIIPKSAFIEAFEKYIYNPTVITCKPISNEETEKLIKSFQSGGVVPDNLQGWRYEETPNEIPTVETSKVEHKAYNEGFKDGVEQGIKLSEKPQGEWIRTGSLGNGNAQYECSNCHYGDEQAESQEVPYCWHCGASMRKGGAV